MLLTIFLFLGCVNVNETNNDVCGNRVCEGSESVDNCFDDCSDLLICGNNICEENETILSCPGDCPTVSPAGNSNPTIGNIVADPSNPGIGQVFVLKVNAADDKAVSHIFWQSSKPVITNSSQILSAGFFECSLQPSCSHALEFKSEEAGLIEIIVYATDSLGLETAKTKMQITVQSFREDTAFAVCGNNDCEPAETIESCSNDCETLKPANICGNNICEGGESFESCPTDCSVINGLGNVCGNNDCEAGETTSSCSADCVAPPENECTFNSDCSYKEICSGGKCIDVECTNSGQCGSCERCSENICRSCDGPFGCTC